MSANAVHRSSNTTHHTPSHSHHHHSSRDHQSSEVNGERHHQSRGNMDGRSDSNKHQSTNDRHEGKDHTPDKDPARVTAGLKATLSNPNVSDSAKDRAIRRLDGLTGTTAQLTSANEAESVARNHHHVQAKKSEDPTPAQQAQINEVGETRGPAKAKPINTSRREPRRKHVLFVDEGRPLDGYKAALHSPKSSKAAKDDALAHLEFHCENSS